MVEQFKKSTLLILFLSWFIILVCFKSTEAQEGSTEHKVIFLQIINRHGERSPLMLYPTDPNPISVWPEGKAKLTMVWVNSTKYDYSLKSAETLLAALYAPTREWKFVEDLDWQPIPIHYEPNALKDGLLTNRHCKIVSIAKQKLRQTPEYKAKLKKFMPMLRDVMLYSGIENDYPELRQFMMMVDDLQMEKANGLIIPFWAQYYWSEIDEFFGMIFESWVTTNVVQQMFSSFLVQKIVEKMEQKITGELPDRKVQVYSVHDVNLALLLKTLGAYNDIRPPSSSTISLELHESPNNQKSVRILYLNSTEPEKGFQEPHVLTISGCTEYCPYEYFLQVTKGQVTAEWDWDTVCQNDDKTNV